MSRHIDRTHVFKLVFQIGFLGAEEVGNKLEEYLDENLTNKDDRAFITEEFKGVVKNLDEIDSAIKNAAIGWSLERIDKTDIAILRLAAYEIMYCDIPDAVAVNEAVLLAKEFSGDKAPGFVNGLLAHIIKEKS